MYEMFVLAGAFNGDVSSWDVSRVTTMRDMFSSAYDFNGDVSSWDVSRVTDMQDMFRSASAFNGDVASWDVSRVQYMQYMFFQAYDFNRDISGWDISRVTTFESMFQGATAFSQTLCWDIPGGATTTNMVTSSSGSVSAESVYAMSGSSALQTAVGAWCSNATTAETTYGHIKCWD